MNLHSCERNNAWKTQKLGEGRGDDGGSGQKLSGGRNKGGGTMVDRWMENDRKEREFYS